MRLPTGYMLNGSFPAISGRSYRPGPTISRPGKYDYMSSLEARVAYELDRRDILWDPQVDFAGGQGYSGGMRVDFVLWGYMIALRVQGYWHSLPGARERDTQGRVYLEGMGFRVIDLMAEEVANNLRGTLDAHLGIPIGTQTSF